MVVVIVVRVNIMMRNLKNVNIMVLMILMEVIITVTKVTMPVAMMMRAM